MTHNFKLKGKVSLLVLFVSLSLFAAAYAGRSFKGRSVPDIRKAFEEQAPAQVSKAIYVLRGRVGSQLAPMLDALGNRFEKTGSERVVMLGTLTHPNNGGTPIPIRLFLERPGRVRLEQMLTGRTQVTLFDDKDGRPVSRDGEAPTQQEQSEIETLAFDTVDRFLLSRMDGQALRFIGSKFRIDDGKTPNYTGPYYDVYQVVDQLGVAGTIRVQPKFFLINSKTQLLELIRYENSSDSNGIRIEIRLENWQRVSNQLIPAKITRLENGTPAMQIQITNATFGPSLPDGIFSR